MKTNPTKTQNKKISTTTREVANARMNNTKGSIIILNTLVFMMISVSIVVGISRSITNNFSMSKSYIEKEQILMSMSSLANEVVYKIQSFENTPESQELTLNDRIVHVEIENINSPNIGLNSASRATEIRGTFSPGIIITMSETQTNTVKKITITSDEIRDTITILIEKDTETEEWNVIYWIQD